MNAHKAVPDAMRGCARRDARFLLTLIQDGSAPQTWSVEPTLPSFLTLDTASAGIFQTTDHLAYRCVKRGGPSPG